MEFNSLPGSENNPAQKKKIRRIMGIDPGLAHTGFGIIDYCNGRYRMVSYGIIETKSETPHPLRLLTIYNRLQAVIDEFHPDESSMEALFFARNVSSAINVAEAKGVVTLCLAQNAIPVFEYKPNQIKQAVTGTTQADKALVEKYVQILLKLDTPPEPDHAADALAGAITHIHNSALTTGNFNQDKDFIKKNN